MGLVSDKIEALVQEVQNEGYDNLQCILLVKDCKLVLQEYLHGYNRLRMHDVASVTKSVTSILIGITSEQGVTTGTDQSHADLLPDCADLIHADPVKRGLKLWQIPTVTSGFEWDEETYPNARNPAYTRFVKGVRDGGVKPENLEEYFGYGLYVERK